MKPQLWRLGMRQLSLALAIWSLFGVTSRADFVVAPNSLTNTEGDINNGFPYNIGNFNLSSQRYQQVYAASQFSSGPITITQISFRPDATFGAAFSSTLSSIRIDLSTTSATPDALSTTFASNVGANDTIVYNGALSLSSNFTGPPGGPKAFDIIINLATPFVFNPGSGNLLMDVRNFGGGITTQFDASDLTNDGTSRAFTTSGGVNSPTADARDSIGLVTRFTFTSTAVPEPASAVLVGLGMLGLVGVGLRRRWLPG